MASRRTTGQVGHSERDITRELTQTLAPFMEAGRRGLAAANWRVGMEADDLVAPIVLAVIAEVQRRVVAGGKLVERVPTAAADDVAPAGRGARR
ncbi:hypothetical protein [Nonomuraea sp. NPDC050786]|uniref:hypothetical protein n=1 Tax=Nonomuraea sp. NPDC050786 TaxID=3154840 RepID=UPI0033F8A63E